MYAIQIRGCENAPELVLGLHLGKTVFLSSLLQSGGASVGLELSSVTDAVRMATIGDFVVVGVTSLLNIFDDVEVG